jgi:hypothetical protein
MIKQNINISYDTIIDNYNKLNCLFLNVIKALYRKAYDESLFCVQSFESKNIINIDAYNTLRELDLYKNKTGIYIFLDENIVPVYIGEAGKQGGKHSLKDRLGVQFKCDPSNATLAKNISTIETLLQNTKVAKNDLQKEMKQLILKYAPTFIVISLGDITEDNVKNARAIEQVLIALFNSKYNK